MMAPPHLKQSLELNSAKPEETLDSMDMVDPQMRQAKVAEQQMQPMQQ